MTRSPTAPRPPERLHSSNSSGCFDYQDCEYAGSGAHALQRRERDGVEPLATAAFRLGGIDLVDPRDSRPLSRCRSCCGSRLGSNMARDPAWLEPTAWFHGCFMPEDERSTIDVAGVDAGWTVRRGVYPTLNASVRRAHARLGRSRGRVPGDRSRFPATSVSTSVHHSRCSSRLPRKRNPEQVLNLREHQRRRFGGLGSLQVLVRPRQLLAGHRAPGGSGDVRGPSPRLSGVAARLLIQIQSGIRTRRSIPPMPHTAPTLRHRLQIYDTSASVVSMSKAMDAAFCSAVRTTSVGSSRPSPGLRTCRSMR